MAPSLRVRTAALILANLLLPVAVLVFASGFFPYKPVLPGLATFAGADADASSRAAPFDRVVFMVVDALRSDFVYGHDSGFHFTQSLIRSGAAIPFTAHATPPTVTMPRVKALTTGSVPSFIDLILNFAESDTTSSLATQDTWLAQIRAQGRKLVFYGDDTWLKLFPGAFFSRFDGTSSFFVSDFTEVDHNVTRHIGDELGQDDWSAMVLHYLGLDHIGHKTGPQGPNMLPKQKEMDGIVRDIYEAMERDPSHANTLLVLAGDHGMNAGGNHGGSGPGETEPALLFASSKFRNMQRRRVYECPTAPKAGTDFHFYSKVEQSDLVPTLAGLMGLPIPRNSLGVMIPELTGLWAERDRITLLQQNARQVLDIIHAAYGIDAFRATVSNYKEASLSREQPCRETSEGEQRLACLWAVAELISETTGHATETEAETAITDFLLEAQDTMSGVASSYHIPHMICGLALAALTLVLALLSGPALWPPSPAGLLFTTVGVLYAVMMFASSYVEEEQHFWYWLTPAWMVLLGLHRHAAAAATTATAGTGASRRGLLVAVMVLLAIHRVAIRWNQTGQKHAGAADIVHTVFPDAHVLMWLLILSTYVYNAFSLVRTALAGIMSTDVAIVVTVALIVPSIVFKLNFTQADAPELVQGLAGPIRAWTERFDLVVQARLVFLTLALVTVVVIVLSIASYRASARMGFLAGVLPTLPERLHHLLTLFLMTQTRAPNVPLFLGLELQREALGYVLRGSSSTDSNPTGARPVTAVALTTLLVSHVYFFCMGGSNSISSIDLSNAYNGVADYNIAAVGVLLFASNWAGPIWWCSAANLLLTGRTISAPTATKPKPPGGRTWIDDERTRLHEESLKAVANRDGIVSAGRRAGTGVWQVYLSLMTAYIAISLSGVMAACTALRTHLFIWTVFSPKYLYAMAWGIGWHLIVNVVLGSVLAWASTVA